MRKFSRKKLKQVSSSTYFFCLKASVKAERVVLRKKAGMGKMNREIKARLEEVRKRTPRYLFRLWSNSEEETPSGGHPDLNTTTAITPLAFSRGKGHKSAYHMTQEEFTSNAKCHLNTCSHIETEFSSWCGSLSFILNKCPGVGTGGVKLAKRSHENLHVSIIDTKMLWETNQAFYVPLLDFLSPGNMNYSHEYLVHGSIEGPWYKAIPYSVLEATPGFNFNSSWYFRDDNIACDPLTKEAIQMARTAGELYGETFALPMMLAILSCQRREEGLWKHGVGEDDLKLVFSGMKGLEVPHGWKKDKTITGHIISTKNYSDTKQMTRLMRALVANKKGKVNLSEADESGDEESAWGEEPDDDLPEAGPVDAEVEVEVEEAPKISEEVSKDEKGTEVASQKVPQAEPAADVVSKTTKKKGKVRDMVSKLEKESDATSAAKAVWRRTYSKGSSRLQRLAS